jgi:hypothetical protein
MATSIVDRKPGEGRGPAAPPPAAAQGNLASLADSLGTNPDALTEKLMWSDTSDLAQSTPWDAGRDVPTSGLLVDDYA